MPALRQLPDRQEIAAGAARVVEVLRPHWSLLLLLLVGGGLFAALVGASAEVYDAVADDDGVAALDQPVLDGALELRNPALDEAVTFYTDLGGVVWAPILTTVVVVGLSLLWRTWVPVVLMVVATAGSLAMTSVGKAVVGRDRPDMSLAVPPYEVSAAFPSGHALNATVIAGMLAYLVVLHVRSRALSVLVVVLAVVHAVLMGLSRVYLGHHWLTDVVVAWCLGGAWLAVVITTHQLLLHRVASRSRLPGSTDTVTP